jgi:hypothetical protein
MLFLLHHLLWGTWCDNGVQSFSQPEGYDESDYCNYKGKCSVVNSDLMPYSVFPR